MSGLAAFLNSDPWQLCSPAAATSNPCLPASNHSIPCIRLVLTGEQTSSVVCLAIDRRLQSALNEMRIRSMCAWCGQSRNGNLFRRSRHRAVNFAYLVRLSNATRWLSPDPRVQGGSTLCQTRGKIVKYRHCPSSCN